MTSSLKDTNPKDAVGTRKAGLTCVPGATTHLLISNGYHKVAFEVGVGMLEGARKYGRHNYRESSVRLSVYADAIFRHVVEWASGNKVDKASGLSHLTKIIAGGCVLLDCILANNWVNDQPPLGGSSPVEATTPLDKLFLHSIELWEGEDVETALRKVILAAAEIRNEELDGVSFQDHLESLHGKAAAVIDLHPDPKPPHLRYPDGVQPVRLPRLSPPQSASDQAK